MGRVVAVLAAMALVGMLVFVGMTIDLALHGAYVSGGVERFPGAEMVAGVSGAITPLGLLALPLGTVLGLVLTLLSAGFVANIPAALLTLPAPVALVIYCALARRARLGGSGIAGRGGRAQQDPGGGDRHRPDGRHGDEEWAQGVARGVGGAVKRAEHEYGAEEQEREGDDEAGDAKAAHGVCSCPLDKWRRWCASL